MTEAAGELVLACDLASVPVARRFAAGHVAVALDGAAEGAELAADTETVVAELVGNAVLHGEPPIVLRVACDTDSHVHVRVRDGSRRAPHPAFASRDALSGRGLGLVGALSLRWGVRVDELGKWVWAELAAGANHLSVSDEAIAELLDSFGSPEDSGSAPIGAKVCVEGVPTRLLLAAKEHIDGVVRELRLTDLADGTTTLPPPLAELVTSVVDEFGEARRCIRAQLVAAVRAGEDHVAIGLVMSEADADAAERFLAGLAEADRYSRAVRLLSLEAPPEFRVLRQWYLRELIGQARAAAAGHAAPPPRSLEQALLDAVHTGALVERQAHRAAGLENATVALAEATDVRDTAAVVLDHALPALGTVSGAVVVIRDGEPSVAETRSMPATAVRDICRLVPDSPCGQALSSGAVVTVESRAGAHPELPAPVVALVPVRLGEQPLGVLLLGFPEGRLLDEAEQRFARSLAAAAALALAALDPVALDPAALDPATLSGEHDAGGPTLRAGRSWD